MVEKQRDKSNTGISIQRNQVRIQVDNKGTVVNRIFSAKNKAPSKETRTLWKYPDTTKNAKSNRNPNTPVIARLNREDCKMYLAE